jgi:hydrogenase large subunit
MPKTFLPLVGSARDASRPRTPTPTPVPTSTPGPGPTATPQPGTQRLAIDPIPRVEGHLRLEVSIQNGIVVDAWSSGTSFGGMELVLQGRDPREAWLFAQRICGVCTTVHAIASVRAVENALGLTIPTNARIMRNLLEAAQFVQDHVVHFYHLHALDWVDIVSALSANPAATSTLATSQSTWPNSSAAYFTSVQARLQTFVSSGQLGLFANSYWGHPAYKLSPEANLLAVAHYLEALDWQREIVKIQAMLGGKNPHPSAYVVGGMSAPLNLTSNNAINSARLSQMQTIAAQALDFVSRVYIPDLLLVASYYKEWAGLGAGVGNFLSFGDFPQNTSGAPSALWLPQGVVMNRNLGAAPQPVDQTMIKEYVAHSWYQYAEGDSVGKHPSVGVTQPNFTGPQPPYTMLNTDGKYSWLKAPRYNDAPMEVGPLARMVVAYAAGHTRVRQLTDQVLAKLGVGASALFSTLGRVAARGIETLLIAEQMGGWITELQNNMTNGDLVTANTTKWDPSTWPAQAVGYGYTEAPRGALGHWVSISNGKIANYQAVVSTTWNGSPRDARGQRGPFEEALIGTPVADPQRPVEVLRTIHSFDPCMACSVHLLDNTGAEVMQIQVV